jgi:hypothetical protein
MENVETEEMSREHHKILAVKIPFIHADLEHLWCVGGYRRVDVKQTPYSNFIVRYTQKQTC